MELIERHVCCVHAKHWACGRGYAELAYLNFARWVAVLQQTCSANFMVFASMPCMYRFRCIWPYSQNRDNHVIIILCDAMKMLIYAFAHKLQLALFAPQFIIHLFSFLYGWRLSAVRTHTSIPHVHTAHIHDQSATQWISGAGSSAGDSNCNLLEQQTMSVRSASCVDDVKKEFVDLPFSIHHMETFPDNAAIQQSLSLWVSYARCVRFYIIFSQYTRYTYWFFVSVAREHSTNYICSVLWLLFFFADCCCAAQLCSVRTENGILPNGYQSSNSNRFYWFDSFALLNRAQRNSSVCLSADEALTPLSLCNYFTARSNQMEDVVICVFFSSSSSLFHIFTETQCLARILHCYTYWHSTLRIVCSCAGRVFSYSCATLFLTFRIHVTMPITVWFVCAFTLQPFHERCRKRFALVGFFALKLFFSSRHKSESIWNHL